MSRRNGAIDFWKFVFSLVIVFFHGRSFFKDGMYMGRGYLAVDFFFIVTGIMMCLSSDKHVISSFGVGRDTFEFIKRKVLILMPNYYIAWIITFTSVLVFQIRDSFQYKYLMDSYGELFFLRAVGFTGIYSNNPTWYISAMLMASLLIYPLLRKFKEYFFCVFAPLVFLFLMGMMRNYWGCLNVEEYLGICSSFLMRAIMGILFGCICYKIAEILKKYNYRFWFASLISLAEVITYVSVIIFMVKPVGNYDFLIVIFLGGGVILTYSERGVLAKYCNYKIFGWLGELSLNLYLGHYAIMKAVASPIHSQFNLGLIYIIGSFINALFIMYFSKALRKLWLKNKKIVKKMIILD